MAGSPVVGPSPVAAVTNLRSPRNHRVRLWVKNGLPLIDRKRPALINEFGVRQSVRRFENRERLS
jgi:hypothetical protein